MWAKSKQSGFTIVELLIVIVVIGILAAITLIAYNGIQNRARLASLQSDLETSDKILENYKIANAVANGGEFYPAATSSTDFTNLVTAGVKQSAGTTLTAYIVNNTTSPANYCLTATNSAGTYSITSTSSGPVIGTCVTNMETNPGFESNSITSYTVASNNTLTPTSTWAASGTYSAQQTPTSTSNNDTYFTIGGDLGAFRAGLQAGKSFTISATTHLTAALTGTLGGNGSRQITAWYTTAGGSNILTQGTQAPNAAGDTRVFVSYSIPSDATGAWLRFYNGSFSGAGSVWWDNIMMTEGLVNYAYHDGSSPGWFWNGTPNNSTSTGPATAQ